jgi:hypothetical protein
LCGRFVQFSSLRTLETHFQIEIPGGEIRASYNIAPSQEVLAIVHQNGRRMDKFHWGLVPFWSKKLTGASRLINARAETVAQKPSFRTAFKRRRCLILSDGYYEWKGEKGNKQPYFMFLPDQQPFAFAGLWETWKPKNAAEDQIDYSQWRPASQSRISITECRLSSSLRPMTAGWILKFSKAMICKTYWIVSMSVKYIIFRYQKWSTACKTTPVNLSSLCLT